MKLYYYKVIKNKNITTNIISFLIHNKIYDNIQKSSTFFENKKKKKKKHHTKITLNKKN
jgi:hypothetical protein